MLINTNKAGAFYSKARNRSEMSLLSPIDLSLCHELSQFLPFLQSVISTVNPPLLPSIKNRGLILSYQLKGHMAPKKLLLREKKHLALILWSSWFSSFSEASIKSMSKERERFNADLFNRYLISVK